MSQSLEMMFGDVENTITDPVVRNIISDARDINRALQRGEIAAHDALELARQLDVEAWGDFIEEAMVVTGHIRRVRYVVSEGEPSEYIVVPEYDGDMNPADVYVDEQLVQSLGFLVEVDRAGDLSLKLGVTVPHLDEQGNTVGYLATTPLESLITFPDVISEEHAEALMSSYIPNLRDEVGRRLSKCDNTGEALTILAYLDLAEIDALASDSYLQRRVGSAFTQYLCHIITLDTTMPYLIDYSGSAHLPSASEKMAKLSLQGKELPFTPNTIEIYMPSEGKNVRLYIPGRLHTDTPGGEQPMTLEADGLRDSLSVRSFIYDKD